MVEQAYEGKTNKQKQTKRHIDVLKVLRSHLSMNLIELVHRFCTEDEEETTFSTFYKTSEGFSLLAKASWLSQLVEGASSSAMNQ